MTKLIIGLDIGTTAAKAIVFTEDGMLIDQSREEYRLLFPHPGWAEQNPLELWEGSKRALRRVIASLSSDQKRSIVALSISSQRDTMVPMDSNGNPIRNAITWMDSRSTLECKQLEECVGSTFIYETTGVPISTIWTGSFILWLKNNEPDTFRNTKCFGLVHDYILRQLGANDNYLDYSNACETMLYDIRKREWSSEILEAIGITSQSLLPKLVASGTVVGQISRQIEEEVGLPRETLLVAGGGDQQCAALGAGAINVGDIEIGIGTAANLLAVTNSIKLDSERRLLCHEHIMSGFWVLEGALISAASTLSWVKDIAYSHVNQSIFEQIDDDVEKLSQPGASGVVMTPHFEGAGTPYWDPKARGLYLGLSLSTSKADLARSVMEGIALEIGLTLNVLREWDVPVQRAVISGGAGRSAIWAQIQSNIYRVPVILLKEADAAVVGAAILAGLGAGVYQDAETGVSQLVKPDRVFTPQADKVEMYEMLSTIQMQAYQSLMEAGVYDMLSRFKERFGKHS